MCIRDRADRGRRALAGADRTAARTPATAYGLARSKNRADAGIYRQIQRVAGAVGRETGGDRQGEQADTYIDRAGRASRRSIDKARRPARTGTPPYHTLDISSSKTFLMMFAMLGCIFLQGAFIYRISENNRLLAANDLKYRYVKMRGEIKEKELMELETIFRDKQHTAMRDTVRNQVERYKEAVRRRAEQLERAASKERKAKKLLDDAAQLRGK